MKNLYEALTAKEIRERIAQLGPTNQRQWGKMTAAQAMAHCSSVMEWAVGENNPPRMFLDTFSGRSRRARCSRTKNRWGKMRPQQKVWSSSMNVTCARNAIG